jgi:hypothetical protein
VSYPMLIAAVAAVAAILPGPAGVGPASAQSRNELDLAGYDRGVAAAARSDLAASVRLPDGGQVYLFGDTVAVNGQVICGPSACPHGYPHDSIAIQRPGTATFAMQSCAATGCPYGWQQVPNWPDGSYFWMAAPAVEGSSLYVIGERISQPAGAVQGEYTARFTVGAGDALTYQGITTLTGPAGETQWGSATADPGGRGWWLTGTRNTGGTGGTGCVADCTTMDTAFVPSAALTRPSAWHVQPGVLPSGEGYDLGTVVSMSHVAGHGWVAFTKRDDITGSVLERLNAWHVTGPWHVAAQRWPATPAPGCGWTYSAQAHPASPAPAGQMLVSWASSHDNPGTTCDMRPRFTALPIGSPIASSPRPRFAACLPGVAAGGRGCDREQSPGTTPLRRGRVLAEPTDRARAAARPATVARSRRSAPRSRAPA